MMRNLFWPDVTGDILVMTKARGYQPLLLHRIDSPKYLSRIIYMGSDLYLLRSGPEVNFQRNLCGEILL